MRTIIVVSLLTGIGAPMAALAQQQSTSMIDPATKVAWAVRLRELSVVLDGRLDDAAWRDARFFSDFVQKDPVEGAEPTERTEVAFMYDGDALYVGARMYSNDPATIQALVSRRDRGAQSQHIWISLDTYRDGRTAYSFGITASGVRMDWYHPSDNEFHIDMSWDPVWEGKAHIDSLGWTAEMRIPFSQLRFNHRAVQRWGLNVDRWIPERNEDVFWIPVPKNETGWSSRMGTLEGIEGIVPSRRLELSPYAASNAIVRSEPDASDPFDGRFNVGGRFGGDLKLGLGPNFTLDAAINPDFGQVEADPAVVNLSAFEVFFPERRPFFTEGRQVLSGAGAGYFYSRRIGQAPRGRADGDYFDRPNTSTILGASKVTGRTAGGLSVGALGAVTAREHVRTFDVTTNRFGRSEAAPLTAYGVVRLQQEFGAAASTAGFILTGVRRDIAPGDPLASEYNRTAITGGGDWNLRFNGGEYEVRGSAGFSHVEGDRVKILQLQESSARYFQRPDADYVRVDSTRTALTGYRSSLSVAKNGGRHWLWDAFFLYQSPDFELNDIGRLSTTDNIAAFATLRYRETQPGRLFQRYEISVSQENLFTTDFGRKFGAFRTDVELTWKNFWRTDFTAWIDVRGQSQSATRGGPSMTTPLSRVVIAAVGNRLGAATRWNARIYYGTDELDGLTYRLSGGITLRPAPGGNSPSVRTTCGTFRPGST